MKYLSKDNRRHSPVSLLVDKVYRQKESKVYTYI